MSSLETATLTDGRTIRFHPDMIGEGGMKQVYFSEDKSSVLCFFKDQTDPHRITRLEAVMGKFNPTNDSVTGEYWKRLYCWPTGIVRSPRLGILAPAYPSDYFFSTDGPLKGKEKEGTWFASKKLRKMIPASERGTWINYFQVCILLARAVRRLHQAGLAHSDLSYRNVLIDPSRGKSIVIDIDSLVVPQVFPPDVLGTPGFIAPEVLGTVHLPVNDPQRNHPCAQTDQHALAVLLYLYLLNRHPLRGKKTYPAPSAEEQERLEMGSKALFVEHPSDRSNPPEDPEDLKVPCMALGNQLYDLFLRAFVNGLHSPHDRPAAIEWERALVKTWDLLHPCAGSNCTHRYFVLHDHTRVRCPFCGTKPKGTIPILNLRKEARPGNWLKDSELVLYHNSSLFNWHVYDNQFPDERMKPEDKKPVGYCVFHEGQWLLINQAMPTLTTQRGNRVGPGQAVALSEGTQIRLSQEPHGRIAEVMLLKL